jgi:Skp family chaperone for outer membrane proteins
MAPIYQKAQEEVQKIAKEQGFDILLDASSALYYSDAIVDITAQARKALGVKEGRTLEQLQQEMAAQQQQQ